LPKISPTGKGINIKQTGSYSLTRNKHPMSMPVRHGFAGPKSPFVVNPPFSAKPSKENEDNDEQKKEPNSLEKSNKKLTVGSFTCFDIMTNGSPLQKLSEAPDQKDNGSATSQQTNSTFASNNFEDDVAPEASEEDEEGGGFDLEL